MFKIHEGISLDLWTLEESIALHTTVLGGDSVAALKSVSDAIAARGSAFALLIGEEHVAQYAALLPKKASLLRPGMVISVCQDALNALAADEADAIIAHEEGHILSGHVLYAHELGLTDVGVGAPVVVNTAVELAADAYAAKRVGKGAMRRALLAIFRWQVDTIFGLYRRLGKKPKATAEEVVAAIVADDIIQARLAALE